MGVASCSGKYAQFCCSERRVYSQTSLHLYFGTDMPARSDYLHTGNAGQTPITRALSSRAHPLGNSSRHEVDSPDGARMATATPQAQQMGPSNDAGNARVSSNSSPDQPPHLMAESPSLPSYWVSSVAGILFTSLPPNLVQRFFNPPRL